MKARISNLYRTEAEWDVLDFIPFEGELVVYAPDEQHTYARAKIGDGFTQLRLLPFFTEAFIEMKLAEYHQASIADAGRISEYFKNK